MNRRVAVVTHVLTLAVGLLAGFVWGFQRSHAHLWDQVAVRESNDLINRINILSQLRLGRTDDAVESLERFIDVQVVNIGYAEDPDFKLNASSMPRPRFRALQMAKAYRELYPAEDSSVSPPPSVVFDQVPPIVVGPSSPECHSAFCTLLTSGPAPARKSGSE